MIKMIRKVQKKDIDSILELLHIVHDLHRDGRPDIFKEGTTKYNRSELLLMLKDSKKPIFVYEKDGKIVAYVFCVMKTIRDDHNFNNYDYLFIDDICVLDEYRRNNIGTKLYQYAKDFAKTQGMKSIRLNVWNFNEKAYNFYKKQGMKVLEYVMEETI